jgi:MFS family permease
VVGRLSDLLGRRYFILLGQVAGIVGPVICAKAGSVSTLIGATCITAVAGAVQGLYPVYIQELVPNRYRGWAQGMIAISFFPSLGAGPLIARAFVQHTAQSWRYAECRNTFVSS